MAKPRPTTSRKTRKTTKAHRTTRKAPAPSLPMPELLYRASETPDVVTIPARKVLAFAGAGAPAAPGFQQAIGAIYGIAYTLKFAGKARGKDFKIGPLEARWSADTDIITTRPPPETWRWVLRIAVPSNITAREVADAIEIATTKKGGKLFGSAEAARVTLDALPAQRIGRALHIGPYSDEARTLNAIDEAVKAAGEAPAFTHIEVYLKDPRRTKPEKLETVLLRELRPGAS
jgi:hypothetical protein